jgi:3-mercaptopyruvate sulfurtransferase SseA
MSNSIETIEPKLALKMVKKKDINFISAEELKKGITGTVVIPLNYISDYNILGKTPCSPLYTCVETFQKIIARFDFNKDSKFIFYDDSYGINATTLYHIFESMGYKNIAWLNGNYSKIIGLDPNQKAYNGYLKEIEEINRLLENENEMDMIKEYRESLSQLKRKLSILKPLLLIQNIDFIEKNSLNGNSITRELSYEHLSDVTELSLAVDNLQRYGSESNITIIDSCGMVDIVGNKYGNYLPGVDFLNWKSLVNRESQGMKSKKILIEIFNKLGLEKENQIYTYCMSGSEKAFYMSTALRIAEYNNVKVFTGNWDTWIGDTIE